MPIRHNSACVETRCDIIQLAQLLRFFQNDRSRSPPHTKSGLLKRIIEDFHHLLDANDQLHPMTIEDAVALFDFCQINVNPKGKGLKALNKQRIQEQTSTQAMLSAQDMLLRTMGEDPTAKEI